MYLFGSKLILSNHGCLVEVEGGLQCVAVVVSSASPSLHATVHVSQQVLCCETCLKLLLFNLHSEPSSRQLLCHLPKNEDDVYWTWFAQSHLLQNSVTSMFLHGKSSICVPGAPALLPVF